MRAYCKPNLFIIGAMKSGTSSLHSYLATHPSIFMCNPKEPSYFVDPAQLKAYWSSMWEKGFWRSENNYLSLFEKATGCKIIGESSTAYTKLPRLSGISHRIMEFSPNARLIYVMRDPIERTISHYWHMVHWEGEKRPPLEAIIKEPEYRDASNYEMQLRPYFAIFGSDTILTLTMEELIENPIKTLRNIFAWLDVDSSFVPPNLSDKKNVAPAEVHQVRGRGFLNEFRYSAFWSVIGPHVASCIRTLGRRLSDPLIARRSVSMESVIEYLRPYQLLETERLSKLLGREFPEWTTLYSLKR